MHLKSLTYTSIAKLDLTDGDLAAILTIARDLNAIDGITGLLIFNGTHFLQLIEGAHLAIDELVEKLRRDPRHSGFEIRDERRVDERSFAGWSMELIRVESRYFEARQTIAERLPQSVPEPIRERILAMTERISGTVAMDG